MPPAEAGGTAFFISLFGYCLEGMKKGSTVGRRDDPLWVGRPTYSRFFRRPTVGRKREDNIIISSTPHLVGMLSMQLVLNLIMPTFALASL